MNLLLGLGAALGYGAGDFLVGLAGRRGGVWPVLAGTQVIGLLAVLVVLPFAPGASPDPADLAWGLAAGLGKGAGALFLLRGMLIGRMNVVAPVSSLSGAGLPILAALLLGERPTLLAWAGVALGLLAIGLVSAGGEQARAGRLGGRLAAGFGFGLAAGGGFATLYLALDRTSGDSGIWPVLAAQCAVAAIFLLLLIVSGQSFVPARPSWAPLAGAGVIGTLATVSFLLGTRAGLVSITAVLASLSPAVTVLLARLALAERLPARRAAGLVVAIAALVLIGLG
ncbi:EamA-like transporter family protein [Haloechinothrix alba]|uniref:EamA-like transporter family protein n=1 Tax=Haloechinothrix alba TaxID=664784 RepID=A0A238W4B3_9PSEU|nr:DMT family transporter [Haloechinothrix alba]SNR41241.1 EamA-like transporter family protein [Haloechinothrix alba]